MRLHVVLPKQQPVQDTRMKLRSMVRAGAAAAVRCACSAVTRPANGMHRLRVRMKGSSSSSVLGELLSKPVQLVA